MHMLVIQAVNCDRFQLSGVLSLLPSVYIRAARDLSRFKHFISAFRQNMPYESDSVPESSRFREKVLHCLDLQDSCDSSVVHMFRVLNELPRDKEAPTYHKCFLEIQCTDGGSLRKSSFKLQEDYLTELDRLSNATEDQGVYVFIEH